MGYSRIYNAPGTAATYFGAIYAGAKNLAGYGATTAPNPGAAAAEAARLAEETRLAEEEREREDI